LLLEEINKFWAFFFGGAGEFILVLLTALTQQVVPILCMLFLTFIHFEPVIDRHCKVICCFAAVSFEVQFE